MPDRYLGLRLENRYEVQEILGEGGMANVYKGMDLRENKVVAIKILRDEMRSNEELVRRFVNESRAISVLSHPNIVKVYDVGVGEVPYIAMEFIDGITLKQYIEQRGEALTFKESVHFILQVLRALHNAHSKGIVHRDIKPQNVMLLADGTLRVMDFGIARLARSEIHTAADQAIGSVHYISPEQARGENTDQRSDIYSTGTMMYEMLTGKLPFDSDNALAIAMMQISDTATPIREVNPQVPVGLQQIAEKAMAKSPRRRYQTVLEMQRDVEAFRQNPAIQFDYGEDLNAEPAAYEGKMNKANGAKGAKKKKKKGLLIPIVSGVTAAVVLVCMILSFIIFQTSSNPLIGTMEVLDLPSFVGKNKTEVEAMVKKAPLNKLNVIYEPRASADIPVGQVISQNPTPKQVKANQKVTVVYSEGLVDVEIPDLTGFSRSEAQKAILKLGLRPYVKAVVDESQEPGKVLRTAPEAGVTVAGNSLVTIMVSNIKVTQEITVPLLVGLASIEEAKKALQEADLDLGTIIEEANAAPAGSVIEQYPEEGTLVPVFSTVRIKVSAGGGGEPDPGTESRTVQIPDMTTMSYNEAKALLEALGLVVQRAEVVTSDSGSNDKVVSQNPPAGTSVPVGSVVVLTVHKYVSTPNTSSSSSASSASSSGGS